MMAGSALLLVWYFVPYIWTQTQKMGLLAQCLYFAFGWLLWFGLAAVHSAFFLMLFILFPHVFTLLPIPWSIAMSLALNGLVLLLLNAVTRDYATTRVLVLGIASAGGALLAYFISDIIRQSERRQHLIDQLEAARDSLAAAQRAAGIFQERERLAGELHDTTIQSLIGILMALEAAQNAPSDAARAALIGQADQAARASLKEARQFIWALRPPPLERRELEDGLRYVIDAWSESTNTAARLIVTGESCLLADAVEIALLRVVQEALANVRKHAAASHVVVTLSYMPDAIVLDINDDGCGFDLTASNRTGFGLPNMRRRIQGLGGLLTIESAYREGTTITAEVPLRAAAAGGLRPEEGSPSLTYAYADSPVDR
jgi:signal transduction histidine kinase